MPATRFICPDNQTTTIENCLEKCRLSQRCMFLPTLRAISKSLEKYQRANSYRTFNNRNQRNTYLRKTTNYAVNPQDTLYALHGNALHNINENNTQGNILSEID